MKMILTSQRENDGICVLLYGYEDIAKNAHWGKGVRDVYILHYVLCGEGVFNNKTVKEGQGFVITPKLLHEYHSSKDKPWKYFWVTFVGNTAQDTIQKYIKPDQNGIFDFDFKSNLVALSDSILTEENHISSARALSYFYMLMSYHEKTEGFCANHYVREAKKYIKANFYRSITVKEIADNMGVNDRYLYNLFIKYEGISTKKYLNSVRLKHAQKMLKTDYYRISEIAVSCGFDDVLSFSKFFSKNTGMSPSDFRKRYFS